MGNWISSEENLSPLDINVLVNPSSPSGESPLVCFENLQSGMYIVAFLVIVFPVKPPNAKMREFTVKWLHFFIGRTLHLKFSSLYIFYSFNSQYQQPKGCRTVQYQRAKFAQQGEKQFNKANTHPLDVFSWVHQWPVLKTITSASWYIEVVWSIKSNLNVSNEPFRPVNHDSLTRNGEATKSTEQL